MSTSLRQTTDINELIGYPAGYPEMVFRLYDYRNINQIALDDLPNVLVALGYDPEATLSVATSLMFDEPVTPVTRSPEVGDQPFTGPSSSCSSNTHHVTLHRFLSGMKELQAIRGGKDDLISASFRLFDVQRRGVVSVEDMLAAVCFGSNALSAEEAKEIVNTLRGGKGVKGLSLRDFRHWLNAT